MPNYVLVDQGVRDIENTSIYWRQLIIFNHTYDELKVKLKEINELVEFDMPTELKVTSQLAHGEFVPLTNAIYCPWFDKEISEHFNVGYNKTNNKCCIWSFSPGDDDEAELFIKVANKIPCFYMDGTFGANDMVFLCPEDYEDKVLVSYDIIENNGEKYTVGQMESGRYFVDKTLLNADYVRFCLPLKTEEEKCEWIRKHTTKKLDNRTYIIHQTERFIERAKKAKRFKEY